MGKKGVEEMINEIEIFIDNCKSVPLSNNKISVPKDEIERMLSELKLKLPSEIERCKKIMRNKEAILANARTKSDAIISESVNEANRLVDANHITELANVRANEILDAAREQAQQILDDANAEATEVRLGAMQYTKQKLDDMKSFFAATLEADRENYKNLIDSLENSVYTLDANLNEIDASIGLINGSSIAQQQPVQAQPQQQYYQQPETNQFDDIDDFGDDEDDMPIKAPTKKANSQSFDDFEDDDDEDDDFLDE